MKKEWIKRIEWIFAVALSLVVLGFVIIRAANAGGQWRDESGTLQLAMMPNIADIFKYFDHQTLPPFFALIVRFYVSLFGTNPAAIEGFRMLAGIGLILVAWLNSRLAGGDVPLFLPALFGLNPVFLFWASYEVPVVPIALALGLAAALLLKPSPSRIAAYTLVALLSVQVLINNLVLLLAITIAAILACVVRRSYKVAIIFVTILLGCAASVVVYLKIYAAADWRILQKGPIAFQPLWGVIHSVLGVPSIMPWVWYVVLLMVLAGAVWQLTVAWPRNDSPQSRALVFAILLGALGPAAYYISIRLTGYQIIQSRHFLPLIALVAANLDVLVAQLSPTNWMRFLRIAVVIVALVVMPRAAWPVIHQRQTNIDIVAEKLQHDADPNDLIVLNPWSLGISFNRYYHGTTRWMTVPNISDHRMHRLDLVKQKMTMAFPLDDLENEILATLRAGHRVWIVGSLKPAPSGRAPFYPLPAPDPQYGWQQAVYREAWSQQLAEFIGRRAARGQVVLPPMPNVYAMENPPLWFVEGDRGQSHDQQE